MITDQIIKDIVNLEISNLTDEELKSYGYDKAKLEAEGSIWIVYVYDCMNDYYQRNKKRIDELVNETLEGAKIKI